MMFLAELLETIECSNIDQMQHIVPKLYKRVLRCIDGSNLHVTDRAMCFFENDYFLSLTSTYKDVTYPILVPTIVELSEKHWHKILQESVQAIQKILKDINPQAFDAALKLSEAESKPYLMN